MSLSKHRFDETGGPRAHRPSSPPDDRQLQEERRRRLWRLSVRRFVHRDEVGDLVVALVSLAALAFVFSRAAC